MEKTRGKTIPSITLDSLGEGSNTHTSVPTVLPRPSVVVHVGVPVPEPRRGVSTSES